MNRCDGRIAIVTGAAGGIGTATCRLLAQAGARVIATDLREAPGDRLGAAIDAAGGAIRYLRHDVTDDAQWGAVLAETLAAHGRLDVLVNNAGLFMHGRMEDADAASIDRLFDVNLKGVVLGTQHAFRAMKTRAKDLPLASIVNLSSVAGLKGSQMASLYCLTKGGVRLFSKSCAIEAAHLGYRIRVNSIHPGIIDTDMAQGVAAGMRANGVPPDQIDRMMAGAHPLGRMGQAEDIARGIVYLASDDASFVTGTELVVDGGMTAR
ncbi:MAG: glucose 1-dehydrogenase [Burkholderiales bacterium]|jgi:NAD(P)-dependent dehydrogenase (short-subunit alcohol dehydrogenase family)